MWGACHLHIITHWWACTFGDLSRKTLICFFPGRYSYEDGITIDTSSVRKDSYSYKRYVSKKTSSEDALLGILGRHPTWGSSFSYKEDVSLKTCEDDTIWRILNTLMWGAYYLKKFLKTLLMENVIWRILKTIL